MSEHYVVVNAFLDVEVIEIDEKTHEHAVDEPAQILGVAVFTDYSDASLEARRVGGQLWHVQGHVPRRLV